MQSSFPSSGDTPIPGEESEITSLMSVANENREAIQNLREELATLRELLEIEVLRSRELRRAAEIELSKANQFKDFLPAAH